MREENRNYFIFYDVDTFDYLINDKNWVHQNDAFDEYEWIIDNLDKMLESNDGTLVFIPTSETAIRIDNYYDEIYLKSIDEEV